MENKALEKAKYLFTSLDYLDVFILTEFENICKSTIEQMRDSIVNNGKIGLLYFIEQFEKTKPYFEKISDESEEYYIEIKETHYLKDRDDRLPLITEFVEIWKTFVYDLYDIKKTFFPYERKTTKQNLAIKPNKTFKTFNDLLEEKYKCKEKEIIQVLGLCFPDHYNEEGQCIGITKRNTLAILSTFYKLLVANSIISPANNRIQKVEYNQIFSNTFLRGKSVSIKTPFENDLESRPTGNDYKINILKLNKNIKNTLKY